MRDGGYGGYGDVHKRRNLVNGGRTEKIVPGARLRSEGCSTDVARARAARAARSAAEWTTETESRARQSAESRSRFRLGRPLRRRPSAGARAASVTLLRSSSGISVSPFLNSAAFVLSVAALVLALAAPSYAQMPDVRQMSGVPLPVNDVAPGTVTVRVIRGSLANVVPGQDVELQVGGASRTVKTNDAGRAEFNGLAPGTRVKAMTVVDGERLESQQFDVPSTGGIRLMLVAAAPAGASAPAQGPENVPAGPGSVSLGGQTRFVFEMGDEALTGFYILQIVNATGTPVQPTEVFTLDLPEAAQGASMMQGSSPQASVAGAKLVVAGPFAPGQTQAQVAFTLPYSAGGFTVVQRIPVALAQVTLLLEKAGTMQLESPQVSQHREIKAENDIYILGQGPGLKAGDALTFTVSGLPHRPLWPRNLALTLAALIVGAGIWASARPGRVAAAEHDRRQKLSARRDRLFSELAGLEEQQRSGAMNDDRYQSRRSELVRALERVYAELDEEAAA